MDPHDSRLPSAPEGLAGSNNRAELHDIKMKEMRIDLLKNHQIHPPPTPPLISDPGGASLYILLIRFIDARQRFSLCRRGQNAVICWRSNLAMETSGNYSLFAEVNLKKMNVKCIICLFFMTCKNDEHSTLTELLVPSAPVAFVILKSSRLESKNPNPPAWK